MSQPLKCMKFQEPGEQGNIDRISSLPDNILARILSCLPTKCAVATSILATRWRCLHLQTNCLSFDYPQVFLNKKGMKAHKSGFKKFVYRVLLLHKVSPIKKFQFLCSGHAYHYSDLHAWISAVLSKGVQHVHLSFDGQLKALPHLLFNCQTIVELEISSKLEGFRFPESIYLPSLKIFKLININFLDKNSFGSFFSGCPLLQELEINISDWPVNSDRPVRFSSAMLKHLVITSCRGWVEVDAPNLAYLKYRRIKSGRGALILKNADHLVTANLDFPIMNDFDSHQAAVALMKAVYHVEELYLLGLSAKYLTQCCEDDQIPMYPNLVKFSIGICSYGTWKHITYWLANSPRLETLIFTEGLIHPAKREEKWPEYVELVPFSSGVKVIEAHYFLGYTTELVPLRLLLTNAKELKKLILYTEPGSMTMKQARVDTELIPLLPSRTCVVQLRKRSELKKS